MIAFASALPSELENRMKRHPYQVVGLAGIVGLGVGVVLSSRILRTVASAAAVELVRALVREALPV